jgi:DNA-directed RNA polymerase I subunit RPA1
MFFVDAILVTPTRFRPPSEHDGQLSEHPQNVHLSRILSLVKQMEELASDPQEKTVTKSQTPKKEVPSNIQYILLFCVHLSFQSSFIHCFNSCMLCD